MSALQIVAIALGAWLLIVVPILAMLRAASLSDDASERQARHEAREPGTDTQAYAAALVALMELAFTREPEEGRHAALTANLARGLASSAKLTPPEQALAHTAGLLHGLRRRDFFAGVLTDTPELPPSARRLAERHASLGARVLREVDGMHGIETIVDALGERVDGRGTPYGLRGEEIPAPARVVAIAEAYARLMAAPEPPVPPQAALRDRAGTELDARLVGLFLSAVVSRGRDQPAPLRPHVAEALYALRHGGD
jgi:response regulator RpfG family c-di-GMP phosphodiesterase